MAARRCRGGCSRGATPGARRLAALQGSLPLGGAPRLERLRFSIGPGSEIITFLCRRVRSEDGASLFVAAALGVRAGLLPEPPSASPVEPAPQALPAAARPEPASAAPPIEARPCEPEPAEAEASEPEPLGPLDVPAIHAALRRRWPSRRNLRFLWQSDAGAVCTQVSPPLSEIVGPGNADLVGVDLVELAPRLDPSGRLEAALRSRETWSGVDVAWPIDEASAAVTVGLGAIPAFDGDRSFAGYRGYGVVKLDELVAREPLRIGYGTKETGQVIAFPSKALSSEDQRAFAALAAELRDRAGLADEEKVVPEPSVEPTAPDASHERAPAPEPAELAAASAQEPAPAEAEVWRRRRTTPSRLRATTVRCARPRSRATASPCSTSCRSACWSAGTTCRSSPTATCSS